MANKGNELLFWQVTKTSFKLIMLWKLSLWSPPPPPCVIENVYFYVKKYWKLSPIILFAQPYVFFHKRDSIFIKRRGVFLIRTVLRIQKLSPEVCSSVKNSFFFMSISVYATKTYLGSIYIISNNRYCKLNLFLARNFIFHACPALLPILKS